MEEVCILRLLDYLIIIITYILKMVADKLTPFEDFKDVYSPLAMKGLYRKAVFTALKVRKELSIIVMWPVPFISCLK